MENNNIPSTPLPSMAESDRQLEQEIVSGKALGIADDQNAALIESFAHPQVDWLVVSPNVRSGQYPTFIDGEDGNPVPVPDGWKTINPPAPRPLLQIVEPGAPDPACECGSECGEQKRDQCCGQCDTKVQNSSLSGATSGSVMAETDYLLCTKNNAECLAESMQQLTDGSPIDGDTWAGAFPEDIAEISADTPKGLDGAYQFGSEVTVSMMQGPATVTEDGLVQGGNVIQFPGRPVAQNIYGNPNDYKPFPELTEGDGLVLQMQDQPIPATNEESEPAELPLFSAEQMQEMHEEVIKETAKRYKRENFIPLPGEKGLFSKVMQAIVGGLRKFPKTSAFITPVTLGGILQACAPTMYVIPNVAARIDEDVYNVHSVYSMLSEAARDHAEAMVPGANHEDPALLALRDKLNEMIDHYAQKLITVFETLGAARYVMGASALQDSPIYHTPVIVKQINASLQGLIDRDAYSKAFHRQDVSTTFCTPPDILGVDVLQVLGHMTSQPDIDALQLHLLTVAYGSSKVRVGPEGDLEFADDILDRIGEVLAPQRIWFAQTATWLAGAAPDAEAPVAG